MTAGQCTGAKTVKISAATPFATARITFFPALACASVIGYLDTYRRSIAPLNLSRSMLEFTLLVALMAIAAIWSGAGGHTAGVASVALVMIVVILRRVPHALRTRNWTT